ncbi:phage terminase small subunit [Rahnella aceris]|uniref:phage terminase small subunit n=1 Tax=Rahnella sp. (strain Y9602) TaxID=2703885 RepID=UPI001F53837D|nr:phage terminase small subunit [Rahnella aceris]UNK55010.1 phage terminase small subunit [Rahnella aceris]
MLSPAQRHMMRVSAEKASSQRVSDPLRSALPYGQMLMKLRGDRQILKSIYSVEDKARRKRDMLPAYAPWIAGVLASDAGSQDDVLMTMLQWSLDAGDIRGSFDMARYALKHDLRVPNNKRPTPYLFAEDVALAAMRARSAGQAVSVDDLLTVIDMTLPHDMPDPVRAKLHKITGLVLRDNGQPEQALTQLKRAMQLDSVAGVKKDIEQLERALRPVAVTAKSATAPRKTKPKTAPAKRGRPRKAKPASC